MFLGSATYLGRVSRYLSQVGEEREIERDVEKKRKKEGKEGRGREVSRQDGRKFDIYERGRREGEF